ncbi:ABC transporter permease [Ruminiclostridium papyrosolvens]|uniref:Branched-chain amino acid ABC transporter permease n=1 Tax=Ruminiclostridium papyrosolvens C7 TaxID=1330534 RepID=U4R0U5_9FIRM|nr:ABC transporter permease [Ruminiclostridium papyrosolvens]EPR10320.1 branched-chain amino acid ABC transporter permease [Ruminiclostridium papyrosolvens C7]
MLNSILLAISITLMYSTPLVFGSMGGVISERAGVINLGIEGMMTIGAFTGATVGYYTSNPWLGFLSAGLAGGMLALLHAVAAVSFKANQTVSGIAMNFLGLGLSLFLSRLFFQGATMTKPVTEKIPKIFGKINSREHPVLSLLNMDTTVIIAFILMLTIWFVLYRTKWGLRIRSVGEHPAAADSLGISVSTIRYLCVILSGVFSGFGGAAMTLAVVSLYSATAISGQGFIALAAVIFGKWTPQGAYGACLVFGLSQALVVLLGGDKVRIPSQILSMLPYITTIIVLVLFVGRSVMPKADGIPYEKGTR